MQGKGGAKIPGIMDAAFCRNIIEYARDIIIVVQLDGSIVDANKAAVEAYGYSHDVLRTMAVRDLRAPETCDCVEDQMKMANYQGISFRTVHLRRNGERFPVEVSSQRVDVVGGQVLVSIIRDISHTIAAENAQRESEEKFRLLVENLYTGVFLVNKNKFTYVNKAMQNITGYSEAELLEMDFWAIIDLHQRDDELGRGMSRQMGLSLPKTHKARISCKGGEVRWCEVVVDSKMIAGNMVLIGLLHDVTERVKAEEALAESERRYRLVAENVGDVIWMVDREGLFTYISPSIKSQQGYDPEELLGRSLITVVAPDNITAVKEQFNKAVDDGRYYSERKFFEFQLVHKNGSVLWVEVSASLLLDDNGEVNGVLGVSRDISERKRLQDDLFRLATIDQMTGALNGSRFMEFGNREVERAERYNHQLALFFIDLDYFKKINDTYGHEIGDQTLHSFARLACDTIRQHDVLGRLGGDEFAVLFPETGVNDALNVAERLRKAVEVTDMSNGNKIFLTVSIGVAVRIDNKISFAEMLKKADAALYQAKKAGRNCVHLEQ